MSASTRHLLRTLAGLAVVLAIWFAGFYVVGLDTGLLFVAPALVLVLPLLAGRYPGETLIAPAPRCAVRRPRASALRLRPPLRSAPSGGLLVALALAGRAPPA